MVFMLRRADVDDLAELGVASIEAGSLSLEQRSEGSHFIETARCLTFLHLATVLEAEPLGVSVLCGLLHGVVVEELDFGVVDVGHPLLVSEVLLLLLLRFYQELLSITLFRRAQS